MKYVAVVLASAMLFMGSCSKKNEQKEEVRKKDPHALRYDSLDWKADFKPMKRRFVGCEEWASTFRAISRDGRRKT